MFSFMLMAVLCAGGCGKEAEIGPGPSANSPKTGTLTVHCEDGRLIFSTVDAFDKTVTELMPYDGAQLADFEAKYPCYASYRTALGADDFEKEDVSFTQDDVLGTVLNRYGIVQIGNVAYCVFMDNGKTYTYMANNTNAQTLGELRAHRLGENVVDITGRDIYDHEEKSKPAGCGACLNGKPHSMANKSNTEYTSSGGNKFYFVAKVAYESYGFYNSLYAKITHHKANGTLTPVNFMTIVGCGKYRIRSGHSCIYPISYPSIPTFSVNKLRYNFLSGSKCAREYFVDVIMAAQIYNASGVLINYQLPTYPVVRGSITSCN